MAHGELGAAKAICCVGGNFPRPLIYCVKVVLLEWWRTGKEDEALRQALVYKHFSQKSIHLLTCIKVYSLYQIQNNQNTNEDLF